MENKKLEAEVRKLRADAYFQRLQGPRGTVGEKAEDCILKGSESAASDTSPDICARLLAEERAVQAETEVLRLHTELHAARIQFAIISDQNGLSTTSAPPPEERVKTEDLPDYRAIPCFRYVCGCLRFFILRFFLALCCCFRSRSPRDHSKMDDELKDDPREKSVKTFCVVDRA
jgi:hypothetical protein